MLGYVYDDEHYALITQQNSVRPPKKIMLVCVFDKMKDNHCKKTHQIMENINIM